MARKILGILGGMGPRATAHFYGQLVDHTQAEKDWDHLHVIIDSDVHIPSRTRAILYGEESPVEGMRKSCFGLMDAGCEYIAVPCNSAHYFYDEVVAGNNIPWVNMMEVIAKELKRFSKVLVIGGYITVVKKTYDKYMDNAIYLRDNYVVFELIEKIKRDECCTAELNLLDATIRKSGADCVLLACTELPIMIDLYKGIYVVDGNSVYINELIKICGGDIKDE